MAPLRAAVAAAACAVLLGAQSAAALFSCIVCPPGEYHVGCNYLANDEGALRCGRCCPMRD
jgi:hypothetical protein